jgi:dTDP-4-dehydrorhamnose reductase
VITTARSGGDRRIDLCDAGRTGALISEIAPDVVIHAAGLTDVDLCEREPAAAIAVNRDATANIAAALPVNARLVSLSTDQVYPDTPGPHAEEGSAPVNVYGRSKLAGEQAALVHAGALVLRTNFFGDSQRPDRQSLSDFVTQNLTGRRPVTLFSDLKFSPLHMTTLAALIIELVDRGITGVYNAGCNRGTSKAEFGLAVARHRGLQTETVTIGSSTSIPGRAKRAKDLRMSVSRLEIAFGRPMPTLEEEIAKL